MATAAPTKPRKSAPTDKSKVAAKTPTAPAQTSNLVGRSRRDLAARHVAFERAAADLAALETEKPERWSRSRQHPRECRSRSPWTRRRLTPASRCTNRSKSSAVGPSSPHHKLMARRSTARPIGSDCSRRSTPGPDFVSTRPKARSSSRHQGYVYRPVARGADRPVRWRRVARRC